MNAAKHECSYRCKTLRLHEGKPLSIYTVMQSCSYTGEAVLSVPGLKLAHGGPCDRIVAREPGRQHGAELGQCVGDERAR